MEKQTLTISQMYNLQKLGLDTSKASMALVYENKYGELIDWDVVDENLHESNIGEHNPYIRSKYGVFTLQDVLDLLPDSIRSSDGCTYLLTIYKSDNIWVIRYNFPLISNTLIDAAYKMLCWCIENKYIEVNK